MNAMHRIPALETAEVRMLLNGPESFTPDGAFLLGEAPEVDGFFVGCGMNSVGVASGGGVGRALAEWVIAGEQPMDSVLGRHQALCAVPFRRASSCERIPEELGLHYAIGYPGRELETARNLRSARCMTGWRPKARGSASAWGGSGRTSSRAGLSRSGTAELRQPAWHRRGGARMPCRAQCVALFDQSSFAKLLVEGRDAAQALQRLAANNVACPRQGRLHLLLNERGGIESDLTIFPLATSGSCWSPAPPSRSHDRHWIRRNLTRTNR